MIDLPISKCRSCGAPVIWALTAKGKQQPVDAAPSETGNLILTPYGHTPKDMPEPEKYSVTLLRVGVATLFDPPGPRYMPHHATCPQAAKWKR